MKLISFRSNDKAAWGIVEGDTVWNLSEAPAAGGQSLGQVLRAGVLEQCINQRNQATEIPFAGLELLPPITDPEKILCIGLNYMDHIVEMGRAVPEYPVVFTRFPDSFVGANVPLEAPSNSVQYDYEGELAVVLAKTAWRVTPEEAAGLILGYSVINDGSVRDFQRQTMQFTPGKNFPRSGSFGPWIVTVDEVENLAGRRITTTLDDDVLQQSSLSELIFTVPALISAISQWTPLHAGDVIATGTPGGVGDSYEPKRWMKPGSTVEVCVDGIGTLTNPVVAGPVS